MKSAFRPLLFLCLWLSTAQLVAGQTSAWVAEFNRLLGKYVTPSGVRYGAWKGNAVDMKVLQGVVDSIAREKVDALGREEQLAFYLNAYNAWILHEALEKYPTKSVKDLLFRFFMNPRLTVAGERTSFDRLEKEIIRAKFRDPRVHFALNCASRSCPPLHSEAFVGTRLPTQLEKLAKAFVNSERGVRLSADHKTVELSKIFDWYESDFAHGALAFINERRADPIPNEAKLRYQDYDWSLNETK
ncbi:MAG TPA: DUF547 domain-containing protein [Chthoniobacterales bacterium]|nr:DUF547 domain-containing protein [Chthoniobacterales bacterium]